MKVANFLMDISIILLNFSERMMFMGGVTTENGTIAINFNSISITVPHKYQNSIKNNIRCFLKVLVFTSAVRNNAKAIE